MKSNMEISNVRKFDQNFTVDMLLNPSDDDPDFYIEAPSERIESLIREFNPEYLVYCGPDSLWEWMVINNKLNVLTENHGNHNFTEIDKIKGLKVEHLLINQFNVICGTSFILLKGEGSEELASLLGINICKPNSMIINHEKINNTIEILNDKFNLIAESNEF
jgi:hypothetical protein